MIFDHELMFTDENIAFSPVTSGVVGRTLELAGKGQGKGFKSWIAFAFSEDVSGGGVNFSIETADNEDFTNSNEIPLSLPELSASDMYAGAIYSAPLPVVGMGRYCRLKVNATSATTFTGLKSGFVLDATQE